MYRDIGMIINQNFNDSIILRMSQPKVIKYIYLTNKKGHQSTSHRIFRRSLYYVINVSGFTSTKHGEHSSNFINDRFHFHCRLI